MSHAPCYPDKAQEIDTLLDTLSHHLRREIIHYFENRVDAETATFQAMVAHLQSQLPATHHEHLKVKLVHTDPPKLADRGWIEYDPRTKQIRYRGHETAASRLRDVNTLFETDREIAGDR